MDIRRKMNISKRSMRMMIGLLWLALSMQAMEKQTPLVSNIYARDYQSLNGKWNYIIDPLENGYYDYRLEPFQKSGFFENRKMKHPGELIEYDFDTSPAMDIPSDWNSKDEKLYVYEGTVWFRRNFTVHKEPGKRYVLYFGAVNYDTKVYVNGKKVGEHIGGYTPFNFDVSDVLNEGENFVVLKVDNKRHKDAVPTVNMDWWNYGGITRDVLLAALPATYVEDYLIQLKKDEKNTISGWLRLNHAVEGEKVIVEIPGLKLRKELVTGAGGEVAFEYKAKPELWTPEDPRLYEVQIRTDHECIHDRIGFRTIETQGTSILLNGKPVFLRGISIHEEAPFREGRAWSEEDAVTLLSWAKEMGCNYVRLAHYPHNEKMVRKAEEMGLMVWSEIPVYWTISWDNPDTYQNAKNQLHDMICRDKNRCAIVIWSIANETPHGEARDNFLRNLSQYARSMDNTRLISMAMEVTKAPDYVNRLQDNMNEYVDVVSFNQYIGWYRATVEDCKKMKWDIPYQKPVIISEFGGGAQQGLFGTKEERWTEEYQEELYIQNLAMLDKIDALAGLSPWILMDFKSPRRQLPGIQDFYNRKGLISKWGIRKKAFYVMQHYYENKKEQYK
ncbi:MAG: beta-glucuronidase [Tannerellaceae bacterium]|nr:beta-glucuronidase [Tannerellaceae bacterium]